MLSNLRARARLLLRQLRSDDPARSAAAAARFSRLATLAAWVSDPPRLAQRARLKHALTVIALEHGHPSWRALKSALDRAPADAVAWYPRGMGAFLNRWFARYDDARRSLEAEGGYLFPYRDQYFVCEAGALEVLGLDAGDPDWARIGRDCARPKDVEAYTRLRRRRAAHGDAS
jgi:hypothetical protein